MGYGYKIILDHIDRVCLHTGPSGTTLILDQLIYREDAMLHTTVAKEPEPTVHLAGEMDLDCADTLRGRSATQPSVRSMVILDFAGVRVHRFFRYGHLRPTLPGHAAAAASI